MIKKIILAAINILLCITAGAQENCILQGSMSGFEEETPVYMLRRTGEFTHDTVMQTTIKDGKFTFRIPVAMWGEQYSLRFGNIRYITSFFAEKGNIKMEGDAKSMMSTKVWGTQENDIWTGYLKRNIELSMLQNRARREISAMQVADSVKRQRMAAAFQDNQARTKAYRDSLTRVYPGSVAVLYLYYQTLPMLKYKEINDILARFSPQLATNIYYKEMKKQAELLGTLTEGVEAPDFEVQTPEGGKIQLSSFRGKYVILDFWASWCAPCRKESVFIKGLYEKYHEKGLEVFSVSLDDKKAPWLKAIADDGMTWKHGCQLLKGGKNTPVAKLYGIDGIPAIWLIGPDGIIQADNLKGQKLIDLCDKIFANK